MVDSFASVADVEARWRSLTSDEANVAATLLDDASDMIRSRWTDVDSRLAAGTLSAESVVRVTANMVKRAMIVGDAEGVESRSETRGPFAVSEKFTNPGANLYLTAEDVRLFDGYETSRVRMGWLV